MLKRLLLAPLSLLYSAVINIRHSLFDHSLLKSERFDIPIICVGNITVGGTGKTPMSELLLDHLTTHHSIAILSRGYGRKSRGYREVSTTDSYDTVGDEPLQMKRKYPTATVIVCEKRAIGVRRIVEEHPEVEMIIMDDGFQHRYVTPLASIIMIDATRPIDQDCALPAGSLRDTPRSLKRGDIFVVTKCPKDMSEAEMERLRKMVITESHQSIYFTRIVNLDPTPLYPTEAEPFDPNSEVIILAGIGNPTPLIETLRSRYKVVEQIIYNDHHDYSTNDFTRIERALITHPSAVIITTEKDGIKFLTNNNIANTISSKIYYSPIKMQFIKGSQGELLTKIENYVKKN